MKNMKSKPLFLNSENNWLRTDGPTDGPTDRPSYRDARTHLKRHKTDLEGSVWHKKQRKKNKLQVLVCIDIGIDYYLIKIRFTS